MTRPICSHCDREVPEGDYRHNTWARHRVCGGCRQIVCLTCPDCQEE